MLRGRGRLLRLLLPNRTATTTTAPNIVMESNRSISSASAVAARSKARLSSSCGDLVQRNRLRPQLCSSCSCSVPPAALPSLWPRPSTASATLTTSASAVSTSPRGQSGDRGRWWWRGAAAGAGAAISAVLASTLVFLNWNDNRSGGGGRRRRLMAVSAAEKADDDGAGDIRSSRRLKYNFIADVVSDVASALVYIEIKDLGVRDYFTGVPTTSSNGSGFVVREDGLILTNAHVVINKPNASVQVRLQDGRTFTGVVEDVDVKSDLATVRIPCKGLPEMPLGRSSSVRPGEFVIAMGSPLSLSNTITTGVVSTAARQRQELGLKDRDVPEYIQTDAAITFGNSGGPLVNLDGEAIGINSMKVTPGISFAIPIDYAKDFLAKSEEARRARRGGAARKSPGRRYMGVTMLTINPQIVEELRARLEMPASVNFGIVIFRIIRDSPADKAGLLPGDIVTHINGSPIHGSHDVYKHLESDGEGGELRMRVVRRAKFIEVVVHPEEQ